jgi:GrpB-like predicted nucleotidyltransferase (UPF0157 family)
MPPPIKVELLNHDPAWRESAAAEAQLLLDAMGSCLLTIHHVGSTAITGIHAKPILDLIPVAMCLTDLDACQVKFEALGYEWWGEYGLPGRRYCTRSDAATGTRLSQLHCYEDGSPEIIRHLAFRDYLREHPSVAAEYDREKARCRTLYPDNSHIYGDCKEAWIRKAEANALVWYQARL